MAKGSGLNMRRHHARKAHPEADFDEYSDEEYHETVRERGGHGSSYSESRLRELLDAFEALRKGDLTVRVRKGSGDIYGELADSYNRTVESLTIFSGEVTRVAREVGTEGKLGGQATVEGVTGTWKELTDNVNTMASNLTTQVRNIATVTTAVAQGDLSQKITVDVQGEILELKNTINKMVDNLNLFSGSSLLQPQQ